MVASLRESTQETGVLTVRQLTERIKQTMEGRFPYVWVGGEVTNLARPSSGHLYFSLKDAEALLQCVWFRGNQRPREAFDPLTGEVFDGGPRPSLALALRDGQQIACAGRITVYAQRGGYQLVVDLAQEAGQGRLYQELERLKRALEVKGYFALERKRVLPSNPVRVAVITAPSGAAIHDFLRLAAERGSGAEIRLYPSPVQGDEAPLRLVQALEQVNAESWAEVVVLIRGGGSLEDLWAFNDERVAGAIFGSKIPVLAGIGHEVDTSIADLVADVRAATPSHAAQILWQERQTWAQAIDDAELALGRSMDGRLHNAGQRLEGLSRGLQWLSPARAMERMAERFAYAHQRLLQVEAVRLQELDERVRAWSERLHRGAGAGGSVLFERNERLLERAELRLRALDPHGPLKRGYAMAFTEQGRLVRGVEQLTPGARLDIRVWDGSAEATVTAIHPAKADSE